MSLLPSSSRGSRRSALAGALALLCAVGATAAAVPAEAATYTSGGERCTVVGTSGDDVLVGTSGDDVLCGLGGDDLIRAGDGDDVVAAGAGSDEVYGGAGSDELYGGIGGDELSGGGGTDDLFGGAGGDDIDGDLGGDEIRGGSGGDELDGEGGGDELYGQDGNDDLIGGSGADHVVGGDGTNWCTLDSLDSSTRCKYDREAPTADALEMSRASVNVSDGDKRATARVHVLDDTGVTDVQLSGYVSETGLALGMGSARLVSGTIRNGWWESDFTVSRWSEPGKFTVGVDLRDRVRRSATRYFPDTFRVVNDNPDRDYPTVKLLKPTESTVVDVRDEAQVVVIEARLKDAVSGVYDGNPFCLQKPVDGFYTNLPCPNATLVSGNRYDGVWRARVRIPRGETGGDWNVSLNATDRAHAGDTMMWLGPDLWNYWTDGGTHVDSYYPALPDGTGRFSVLGTSDSTAPSVRGVTISPSRVDTLPGPVKVDFDVKVTDAPREGVEAVGVGLHASDAAADGSAVQFEFLDLRLTSGTKVDGTWSGSYWVPQGTPPGTYYLQVMVNDPTHYRSYFSPGSPYLEDHPGALVLPEPTELVVEDNPAG